MFEEVVLPHGAPARARRLAAGPVVVALHALVIGAALASALLNGKDLPAPDPPVRIVLQGFSPPAGDPPLAGVTRTDPARSPGPIRRVALPTRETPPQIASPESFDERDGAWGSPDDGSGISEEGARGVPWAVDDGGLGEGPGPGDTVYELGGAITPPRLVHRVDPVYPEIARKFRVEGVLVVRAIIGQDGRVENLTIERALYPPMDEAVRVAIQQWRYTPAMLKGHPIRVALTVTVRFDLR